MRLYCEKKSCTLIFNFGVEKVKSLNIDRLQESKLADILSSQKEHWTKRYGIGGFLLFSCVCE